jgi:hypothetical protein
MPALADGQDAAAARPAAAPIAKRDARLRLPAGADGGAGAPALSDTNAP